MMTAGEWSQYWAAMMIGIATLGGMGGLFIWAVCRGAFRNMEDPKTRLLEIDAHTEVRL